MRPLWYVAQALFIGWLVYGVWTTKPEIKAGELAILIGIAVILCAFLTACLTHLWDWTARRLRGARGHDSQPRGDSLSLTGAGRRPPEPPKHVDRIRVSE